MAHEGRHEQLSASMLLVLGTDGKWIVYPIRGIYQVQQLPIGSRLGAYISGLLCLTAAARRNGCDADRRRTAGRVTSGSSSSLPLAAAVAERGSVRLTDTTELSISPVLMLFAAVLFGPLAGGLVGAASELGDSELLDRESASRSPRLKWLTLHEQRFLVGAATGGVAHGGLFVGAGSDWRRDPRNARRFDRGESPRTRVSPVVTSRLRGSKTSVSPARVRLSLPQPSASTRPSSRS